jgi:hypothetical protein
MPLKRSDIHSALKAKGFQEEMGDHAFFVFNTSQGKKTPIYTKTSHGSGSKDIDDSMVAKMARQVKLNAKQFRDLIACTLSGSDYETQLVQQGHVTLDAATTPVAGSSKGTGYNVQDKSIEKPSSTPSDVQSGEDDKAEGPLSS